MIQHPFALITVLAIIELAILWSANLPVLSGFFNIISPIFFIYFLPMLASSLGLIDPQAPVLNLVTTHLLPSALFLLLVSVDIRAIFRLGPRALGIFLIGSAGVMSGTVLAFLVFKPVIGAHYWGGFAALCASWTGGSANMIAVKEALSVPDQVFSPIVVVDTIIPYCWMGLLIALARLQPVFDRWNCPDTGILTTLRHTTSSIPNEKTRWSFAGTLIILVCAFLASILTVYASAFLPVIKNVLSRSAWSVILITITALGLSLTPLRQLNKYGAGQIGSWILYFVLAGIGAKAALTDFSSSIVLLGAGGIIILTHLFFLLTGARLLRLPLSLVAAASQANIGGVASAPVVAAVFDPSLASVGLLMAITGNILGTYLGGLCAFFCHSLSLF